MCKFTCKKFILFEFFGHGPVLLMTVIMARKKNDPFSPREQIKHNFSAVFYMSEKTETCVNCTL